LALKSLLYCLRFLLMIIVSNRLQSSPIVSNRLQSSRSELSVWSEIWGPLQYWLDQPGAPKPKLDNEKPQGKTVPYDEMVKSWQKS